MKSRVPGKMLEINVKVGDEVHEKDVLGVMEAMKMRQSIACPPTARSRRSASPSATA